MLFSLAFVRLASLKAWIRKYAFLQMILSAYVLLSVYIPAIGIQTFPDDWQFDGSIAQQYKQIGNAVPVNLAKEIGYSIVKFLNQYYKTK